MMILRTQEPLALLVFAPMFIGIVAGGYFRSRTLRQLSAGARRKPAATWLLHCRASEMSPRGATLALREEVS